MDPVKRRAALIATAVTVPLVVVLALAISSIGGGGPDSTSNPTSGVLPPVTLAAPPNAARQAAPCAKVLAQLPVQLQAGRRTLDPRVVHTTPDTPDVVAWGEPAVVLQCGAARPKDLTAGSSAQFLLGGTPGGPYWDVVRSGSGNVWTTVDRAAYVSVTIPSTYQGGDVIPPLSAAVAKALPAAVCSTDPAEPDPAKLCTRRKD